MAYSPQILECIGSRQLYQLAALSSAMPLLAHSGCSSGWAAQVFRLFAEHGKSSPLVAASFVEDRPDELLLAFQTQQQVTYEAETLKFRSCPGSGVKLCTARRCCLIQQIKSAQSTENSPRALQSRRDSGDFSQRYICC